MASKYVQRLTNQQEAIKELIAELGRRSQDYHASQQQAGNRFHTGVTWRKCSAMSCSQTLEVSQRFEPLVPPLHNKYALKNFLRSKAKSR